MAVSVCLLVPPFGVSVCLCLCVSLWMCSSNHFISRMWPSRSRWRIFITLSLCKDFYPVAMTTLSSSQCVCVCVSVCVCGCVCMCVRVCRMCFWVFVLVSYVVCSCVRMIVCECVCPLSLVYMSTGHRFCKILSCVLVCEWLDTLCVGVCASEKKQKRKWTWQRSL